ncbi:AraC family transcriptional regulator [Phyllobacterium sp. 628]|uniref:AraC family transcriptional regulator n=1 Tax=Phyllobacterium sp. 628 TaxID=2718938 RepID=UPI0016627AC4|nr:AraC family transcriptional regulator [Phyllobacterium sp. 628]QND53154.1 AraC family transcriptional regulator [Phyllobacterium sp. 628]
MNPVEKAIWYVEGHFAEEITLDDIAGVAGLSRFYLSRVFGIFAGRSVSSHIRGRRLTEAARLLSNGAPDILSVALNAGYNSHEAFTRAFRDQFGLTPEQVRAQRHTENIPLVEAIKMDEAFITDLEEPRVENGKPMLIAGIGERYTCETSAAIPAQWQRFNPYFGQISGQVGNVAYGVCCNGDDANNFDYIAGAEVKDFSDIPDEFARIRIPAQTYLVFSHRKHISTIRSTIMTIWGKWLPESGHVLVDAPNFERYGPEFDPRTGNGGMEIWIPIQN